MPRIARIKLSNLTYHIHSRGNNKMRIFLQEEDYQRYLEILRKYQKKFTFWLYHFALMPNHVHLLLKSESDISKLMHSINLSYAQYFKRKYKYVGHFWQDRFKSHIVENDRYLLVVARYIERNPLRAHLASDLSEYKYSSYNFYAFGKDCGAEVTSNPLYLDLAQDESERQKRFRKFINDESPHHPNLKSNITSPSEFNIINAQFISSVEFAQQLIITTFKERIKSKRGRPRKNQKDLVPKLL